MSLTNKELFLQKKLLYLSTPRQATWLELFFDLIFVVALSKLTHLLAHTHDGHLDAGVWELFILAFIPMWWIWVGHTVYSNRFDADTRVHRVLTLILMSLIMIASVSIGEEVVHSHWLFVTVYGTARLLIAGFYFTAARSYPDKAGFAQSTGFVYLVGALISTSSALFALPIALFVFFGGILFDILAPRYMVKNSLPVDRDHLVERIGLLAIILLGESVISISNGLNDAVWTPLTVTTAFMGFLFICSIWWIYFDSFPLLIESKRDPNGDGILYSQLSTYISFAILANMIFHATLNELNIQEFRAMVMLGLVTFYFGKQTAYWINVPEYRGYIILNTVVMLGIAILSLFLPQAQYIMFGALFSILVYILMNYRAQINLYSRVHL